jgi:hypothetical protein
LTAFKQKNPDYRPEEVKLVGEVSIFDQTIPRSLINIVPEELKLRMTQIAEKHAPWFLFEENKLKATTDPDSTTARLKLTFWDEYTRAQDRGCHMIIANVVRGVCSRDYFYRVVMMEDKALAWIITPPKDYMVIMRDLLEIGLDRMREIITLPIRNAKGDVDVRLVSEILKAVEKIELRVKGAIIQRHLVKQQSLHMHANVPDQIPEGMTVEELTEMEAQLDSMQKKLVKVLPAPMPVVQGHDGRLTTEGTIIDVKDDSTGDDPGS